MIRNIVIPPHAVVRAEYVIDADLPDEERCLSANTKGQRCQLERGHTDSSHIHVTDNYTVGWLAE